MSLYAGETNDPSLTFKLQFGIGLLNLLPTTPSLAYMHGTRLTFGKSSVRKQYNVLVFLVASAKCVEVPIEISEDCYCDLSVPIPIGHTIVGTLPFSVGPDLQQRLALSPINVDCNVRLVGAKSSTCNLCLNIIWRMIIKVQGRSS